MLFKQAERTAVDGEVAITRDGGGENILLRVTHAGQTNTVVMSEHNASRAVAMLSLMLGIRLPPAVQKAIKL